MKLTFKHAGWVTVGLVVAGLVLAWSGLINVAASSGHWMITDWFLHWVMRNSVRAQAAMTVDDPPTDPTGLVSSAGHFAVNCAPCHGAPGERRSIVMQAATPPPPELTTTVDTYDRRELFWIIKHGVKFTPMPAWPTQVRDDEVWRMSAFVQRLPRMNASEYRELAYGPGRVGGQAWSFDAVLADCQRCHDENGRGQADIPVLAGQKSTYLHAALEAFASGRRASGVMAAAAARVDPKVMRALADHYAALPGLDARADTVVNAARADNPMVERIITRGLPEKDLPACAQCHAPGKRPHYPVLAGQKPEYLAARLRRWRTAEEDVIDARRSKLTMPVIARRIPESMIDPLARHFAQQAAPPEIRAGNGSRP
jgi:cytochrome c553